RTVSETSTANARAATPPFSHQASRREREEEGTIAAVGQERWDRVRRSVPGAGGLLRTVRATSARRPRWAVLGSRHRSRSAIASRREGYRSSGFLATIR